MNREIKFRAWIKEIEEFKPLYDIDYYHKEIGVWGCGNEDCGLCDSYYSFDEVVLMQYTGLKDKNGAEIYEGDIVELQGKVCIPPVHIIGKVVFENGGFIVKSNRNKVRLNKNYLLRIIGNVYENKDLLEEINE